MLLSNMDRENKADARRRSRDVDDRWWRIDRRRVVGTGLIIPTPAVLVPAAFFMSSASIVAERRRDVYTADH